MLRTSHGPIRQYAQNCYRAMEFKKQRSQKKCYVGGDLSNEKMEEEELNLIMLQGLVMLLRQM